MIIKKGTILKLIEGGGFAAKTGATAVVKTDYNTESKDYIQLKWVGDKELRKDQRDGGYIFKHFKIIELKWGDVLKNERN